MNFQLPNRITLLEAASGAQVFVRPSNPVLSSAKHFWKNIQVEQHFVAPAETPAVRFHDFGVCVELNRAESAQELERKQLANKSYQSPAEICVVPPSTEFGAQFIPVHSEMLYLHLDPAFVRQVAGVAGESEVRDAALKLTVCDLPLQHLALLLRQELMSDCINGSLYSDSLHTALAVYLIKNYSATRLQTPGNSGLTGRSLGLALEYLNDNLQTELRLSQVAAIAGKSEYHFARLFKQSTGLSVHRYVQHQRVKLAQQLLANRRLTVTEIAHQVGFNSHSRFSALFRRTVGQTPIAYRNSL